MAFLLRNGASPMWRITRNICRSAVRMDVKPSGSQVTKSEPAPAAKSATEELRMGGHTHKVDSLERRFLVWSGKYKTAADVPDYVSQETMEKSRNKARIKIANYMMLLTVLACIGMVISGKRAVDKGDSVQKMNLEWHRLVKEEAEQTAAAAAAATTSTATK